MMWTFAWWLNVASLAGIATLSVPVWSLNKRKRRLLAIKQADHTAKDANDFRKRTRAILVSKQKKNIEDWRSIDQTCLMIGYALLLGSALLRVLFPGH